MSENKKFFDSDDIRVRDAINLHPQFYWRVIYQKAKDNFKILPFMKINNTDDGRADWMDVAVTQKHQIQYAKLWENFIEHQALGRDVFTRDEMMRVQNFRDKIEYNKSLIRLPETHPEYWPLISDFSIRLNAEDIAKLNAIDGFVVEKKAEPKGKDEQIIDLIKGLASQMDGLAKRISAIENNQ